MAWESSSGVVWTSVSGELESEGPCVRSLTSSSKAPRATLAGPFSWNSGVGLVENTGEAGRRRVKQGKASGRRAEVDGVAREAADLRTEGAAQTPGAGWGVRKALIRVGTEAETPVTWGRAQEAPGRLWAGL